MCSIWAVKVTLTFDSTGPRARHLGTPSVEFAARFRASGEHPCDPLVKDLLRDLRSSCRARQRPALPLHEAADAGSDAHLLAPEPRRIQLTWHQSFQSRHTQGGPVVVREFPFVVLMRRSSVLIGWCYAPGSHKGIGVITSSPLVCPGCGADRLIPLSFPVFRPETGDEVVLRRPVAKCAGCGERMFAHVVIRSRHPSEPDSA